MANLQMMKLSSGVFMVGQKIALLTLEHAFKKW